MSEALITLISAARKKILEQREELNRLREHKRLLLEVCESVLAEQEYGQPDRVISSETEKQLRLAVQSYDGPD